MAKVVDLNEYRENKYGVSDIEKYRPIALAPEFLEKKDIGGLESTLAEFISGIVKDNRDAEGITKSLLSSGEGTQAFIGNFLEKYSKALGKSKLTELREFYSDSFEEYYTEENIPKINEIFNSDDTYESVLKDYAKAQEIFKSETGNFSDEEKKKAEKKVKELYRIVLPLQRFEELELNNLKSPIDQKYLKKDLNSPYQEADDYEQNQQAQAA